MTTFFEHLTIKRKLLAVMALDAFLLPLSLWMAFALKFSDWWPSAIDQFWWLFVLAPMLAFPVFVRSGLYRAVISYISTKAFYAIGGAVSAHVVLLMAISIFIGFEGMPLSLFAIYWLASLTFVGGSRALLRAYSHWARQMKHSHTNVVIYGAGYAGAELAEALQAGMEFNPVAFIDDKHKLHETEIRGLKVFPTTKLNTLIDKYCIKQVLLAIPSAPRVRRQQIINYLEPFPIHIKTIPAIMDIISGRSKVEDLREVGIEDILGRAPVAPDSQLLAACITGKSVMVTGAGGSIGSELCRQIINLNPQRLVLFDSCEFALYTIERELVIYANNHKTNLRNIQIIPVLGSINDENKLHLVFKTFVVQTLYHAAAYKHVPLVEYNPVEGVRNNIFGTWYTARAALAAGVTTFIFISTDKAVRPTNVMGATKRMAELVIQALARQSTSTRFSIVRFGNVLGSSGSVVPLFRQQIKNGGPITLTHPDMTRYFMTIPESAQLVIQAGSMAKGGVVFVLDMGKPVRIYDLASRMVSLSGLTLRDSKHPDGDIAIEITQLRPGEKIYEELLLGNNVTQTDHPRILQAQEVEIPQQEVSDILSRLEQASASYDSDMVIKILMKAVDGYKPQSGIKDRVWLAAQQKNGKKQPIPGKAALIFTDLVTPPMAKELTPLQVSQHAEMKRQEKLAKTHVETTH